VTQYDAVVRPLERPVDGCDTSARGAVGHVLDDDPAVQFDVRCDL